jgi:hypothetical protein
VRKTWFQNSLSKCNLCRYASEKVLKQEGVVMLLFTKLGNPECVKQTIAVAKSLVKLNGQVQMGEVNASDAKAEALTKQYAPKALADDAKCIEMVIFPHGAENKEDADPEVYEGDSTDADVGGCTSCIQSDP